MPKSEQGVTSDRYQIIPRTLIFVTKGEQVLLLKGAPTKRLWANRYNGIGGHVEQGEDLLNAARRELLEEASLAGCSLYLCGSVMVDASEQTGIGIFIFRCDYPPGYEVTLQPSQEGELEWVSFSELSRYPLVEDLPLLLPRVLNRQPGDLPFSARSYYDEQEKLRVVYAE